MFDWVGLEGLETRERCFRDGWVQVRGRCIIWRECRGRNGCGFGRRCGGGSGSCERLARALEPFAVFLGQEVEDGAWLAWKGCFTEHRATLERAVSVY